ncbi:MAG: FMN-binding protein [Sulfurimonas sp.]|nr:FMN-binding protein [Sulfurimonas sp.]
MKQLLAYYFFLLALPLGANIIASPIEVMSKNFEVGATVTENNILLTQAQAANIEENSKTKLESKIIRVFKVAKNDKILGFGVLVNKKIRSKNGVVLYIISSDSVLKSVEIVAFNEPLEYIPSKKWISQFNDIKSEKIDEASKNIPTITGATLSAKSIIDGSKIAFAIYNEVLKGN